ncbi:MAG: hypothetical protein ACI3XH_05485 [Phascolarctobacterium sp.]
MKITMELSYSEIDFMIDAVKDKITALKEEQKVLSESKNDDAAHWADINKSWLKDYEALLQRLQEEHKKW